MQLPGAYLRLHGIEFLEIHSEIGFNEEILKRWGVEDIKKSCDETLIFFMIWFIRVMVWHSFVINVEIIWWLLGYILICFNFRHLIS